MRLGTPEGHFAADRAKRGTVSHSAVIATGFVFVLAGVSKVSALLRRSGRWHPLFVTSTTRRRYAHLLLGAGVLLDTVVVLLLLTNVVGGSLAAVIALAVYTTAAILWRSPVSSQCNCFALNFLDVGDSRILLLRNALIALVVWAGSTSTSTLAEPDLLALLGAGFLIAGLAALLRAFESRRQGRTI